MAGLPESPIWELIVRYFEANAVLTGGPDCPDNLPLKDLTNRTAWLKQQVELALSGQSAHGTAVDPHPQYMNAAESDAAIAAAVAALVNASPAALDTLNELAAALGNDPNFASTINIALAARLKTLPAGTALPNTNIGPIWHDDYNSLMTWQVFNSNGANFTGYASVLVGSLLMDTQPTARPGYIKSGIANLSRTAYAGLRGWAMHNGIMVSAGVWAAGMIAVKDNADGTTFAAFDVRGEFPRFWDDGRGVDPGRVFGSAQAGTRHALMGRTTGYWGSAWADQLSAMAGKENEASESMNGYASGNLGMEPAPGNAMMISYASRPRNTPLLAAIKF